MTNIMGNTCQLKAQREWSEFQSSFNHLSKHGLLGLYKSFQVTEIIAFPPKSVSSKPINLLSLLTCSDIDCDDSLRPPKFLNGNNRIKIKALKQWSFGIVRYARSIKEVRECLNNYVETSKWNLAGMPLSTGRLKPLNKQFVPASNFDEVALNKILKNNFRNGSYILELCDIGKENLSALTNVPMLMQELSNEIKQFIPINLASVSDRLGHIILQFPVNVLMASFQSSKDDELSVEVAWLPGSVKRNLLASIESVHDGVLQKHHEIELVDGINYISKYDFSGGFKGRIWDRENKVLLFASSELSFVKKMNFRMSLNDNEPRQFVLGNEPINIAISGVDLPSQFGEDDLVDLHRDVVGKRLFRDEIINVSKRKEFVQYGKGGCKRKEHERAIEDLRTLIKQYGKGGVWLWDPYLSAEEVIETLFFCPYSNVELRALSGGESPLSDEEKEGRNIDWSTAQHSILEAKSGNRRGLKLEFRYRNGKYGWAFHDRFIIFPREDGETAMAWSLGTSVNSMGHQHHTLQKVLDGELIKHSFEELWDQLEDERHLLWKS